MQTGAAIPLMESVFDEKVNITMDFTSPIFCSSLSVRGNFKL